MPTLFDKLQWKGESPLLIAGAPREFAPHRKALPRGTAVTAGAAKGTCPFALVFVRTCAQVAEQAPAAVAVMAPDGKLWFAYPKKSSKKYTSDLSRDAGWEPLGELGFEGVRQVAIDDDWSALRFRHSDDIPTLRRDPRRALSAAGRRRVR